MSNEREIKVMLKLNGEDAATIVATLQMARNHLQQAMDQAIEDGLLPIVQLTKTELERTSSIIKGIIEEGGYSSDSFIVDEKDLERKMRQGIKAIELMKDAIDKDSSDSKPPPKEEGKKWEDAGDNVINILDKLKEDKPDDET